MKSIFRFGPGRSNFIPHLLQIRLLAWLLVSCKKGKGGGGKGDSDSTASWKNIDAWASLPVHVTYTIELSQNDWAWQNMLPHEILLRYHLRINVFNSSRDIQWSFQILQWRHLCIPEKLSKTLAKDEICSIPSPLFDWRNVRINDCLYQRRNYHFNLLMTPCCKYWKYFWKVVETWNMRNILLN